MRITVLEVSKWKESTASKPSGQYGSSDRLERRGYSRAKTEEFLPCTSSKRERELEKESDGKQRAEEQRTLFPGEQGER